MAMKQNMEIILEECAEALKRTDDARNAELLEAVLAARKVYFYGVGRVMLSLQAICKRLAHLGIDAHCVGEITEPAITEDDLLIVASGSGESLLPKAIAQKAKQLGAKLAWIGSNEGSAIAGLADVRVRIPVQTKLYLPGEIASRQPMTSLFEQALLLYGDALAMEILARRSLDLKTLWQYHANLE